MGSGKTTFINSICAALKVKSSVSSPTYAIINEYESSNGTIFHIDLYRLKDEEEVMQAGVIDCIYSGNTCFVEWPARAPDIFPPETVEVFIDVINEESRRIRIEEN
jgi:tRNA threonylcarbamoyladenosine biosynthesis protein TsaE